MKRNIGVIKFLMGMLNGAIC